MTAGGALGAGTKALKGGDTGVGGELAEAAAPLLAILGAAGISNPPLSSPSPPSDICMSATPCANSIIQSFTKNNYLAFHQQCYHHVPFNRKLVFPKFTSPNPPAVGFCPFLIAFRISVAFHFAYLRFSIIYKGWGFSAVVRCI